MLLLILEQVYCESTPGSSREERLCRSRIPLLAKAGSPLRGFLWNADFHGLIEEGSEWD